MTNTTTNTGTDIRSTDDGSRPSRSMGRRLFLVGGGAALAATGVGLTIRHEGAATAGPGVRAVDVTGSRAAWHRGATWDWRQFREVPVNTIDNKLRLTSAGPVGSAVGVGGRSANDRRIFVRRDVQATDVEVAAEFAASDQSQFGLAMRVQPDVAVIVWQNIFYVATSNLLQGTWEYDGARLHALNTDPASALSSPTQPVERVDADGKTVLVTTPQAHRFRAGDLVSHEGEIAELGIVKIDATPTPTTYSFAAPVRGSWTSGGIRRIGTRERRRVGARLIGGEVRFKQWLPGETEPHWDDHLRVVTTVLPSTLTAGTPVPTGPGGVGVMLAHLGDGLRVDVTGLRITPLG